MLAELGYCIENRQTRTCAALGVVVVRLGIAEVRHHPVAEVLRDTSAEALDRLRRRAMILADDLSPLFGIEMAGDLGRADEVAEKYCQMPTLTLWDFVWLAVFDHYACGCGLD